MSILEPFSHPFEELRKQAEKLFHTEHFPAVWRPNVDIIETENQIVIRADLPGMQKDELSITAEDGKITIRGERKFEKKHGENEVIRKLERHFGRFIRTIPIHQGVKDSDISAAFENGVLEIKYRIPEDAQKKAKQIAIQAKL